MPHALASGTRARDCGGGGSYRGSSQGNGRHRLQQHRGSPPPHPLGRQRGADAALVVAPYYNKPTQEGFFQHFKALAEAVDIPICVYNIPGRTGKNIEADTIVRMAQVPNITMVKEASGSMDAASQILAKTDLTVLSGDDSLTLPLMSLGGQGVVSVVGNIVPQDVIAMIRCFQAGNLAEARRMHFKLFPLCRDMLGLSTNPIPIKAAMEMLGRDTGDLRMPLTRLSEAEREKLKKTLVDYGLLVSMRSIFVLCEYATLNGGEQSMLSTLSGVIRAGYRVSVAAPLVGPLAEALRTQAWRACHSSRATQAGYGFRSIYFAANLPKCSAAATPIWSMPTAWRWGDYRAPLSRICALPSLSHLRDIASLSRQAIADLNCHATPGRLSGNAAIPCCPRSCRGKDLPAV